MLDSPHPVSNESAILRGAVVLSDSLFEQQLDELADPNLALAPRQQVAEVRARSRSLQARRRGGTPQQIFCF